MTDDELRAAIADKDAALTITERQRDEHRLIDREKTALAITQFRELCELRAELRDRGLK